MVPMTILIKRPVYSIYTDAFSTPIVIGETGGSWFETTDMKEAIRKVAYLVIGYPESTVILLKDGVVVGKPDLARMAEWIIRL